jgi:uncharacterized protein YhfF
MGSDRWRLRHRVHSERGLNRLVLSGQKVATTGLLSEYDEEGEDLEQIGEHLALVDNADK